MKKKFLAVYAVMLLTVICFYSVNAEQYIEEEIYDADAMCVSDLYADNSSLYEMFKNTSLSGLRTLFNNNKESFSFWKNKGDREYTDSEISVIILDAMQKDFSSFEELDENVASSAEKLDYKKSNSSLLGLTGYSSVDVAFDTAVTNPDDIFRVDDKEFIVLDEKIDDNGEHIFFVIAKDYYGYTSIDPAPSGKWDDNTSNNLPYKLTNQMAFGNYPDHNMPEAILMHMDMLHEWNIEPGSCSGYTNETVTVGPISVISATEYIQYGEKIGLDTDLAAGFYWTRTPVLGSAEFAFTVNFSSPKSFNKNKGWGNTTTFLRPVFYLKESFFKNEKMQKCGANVTRYLDNILTESELDSLYSDEEMDKVFGALSVEPKAITGDTIVGQVLVTDYEYSGSVELVNVDITWERSADKIEWTHIEGAQGKSYTVTQDDAGHYIRAVFRPTFDSVILGTGLETYAVSDNAVYTEDEIKRAVSEINNAQSAEELKNIFVRYDALFKFDFEKDNFTDKAAEIFMKDNVDTVDAVMSLYRESVALCRFIEATERETDKETVKASAEDKLLLGGIKEYSALKDSDKEWVINKLANLDDEKYKMSEFKKKEYSYIMLARFNSSTRADIIGLLTEYCVYLEADISGLTEYQLGVAGGYVAGKSFDGDEAALKNAVQNAVREAKKASSQQQKPSAGGSGGAGGSSGGGSGSGSKASHGLSFPTLPVISTPVPIEEQKNPDEVKTSFSDLENVKWAAEAIENLARKGVLSGTGEGVFEPERAVTRNEFVKMIVTAFELKSDTNEVFYDDVPKDDWSMPYIAAAKDSGIVMGIDAVNFGNGINITREDVAVIAVRLLNHFNISLEEGKNEFSDSDKISGYAIDSVLKVNQAGIMTGLGDGSFAPKQTTTRAMAAVIIYRIMEQKAAEV